MFQFIAACLALVTVYCTFEGAFWMAAISAFVTVLWVIRARPRRRRTSIPFPPRDRPQIPIIR